jgi:hypothetical protein
MRNGFIVETLINQGFLHYQTVFPTFPTTERPRTRRKPVLHCVRRSQKDVDENRGALKKWATLPCQSIGTRTRRATDLTSLTKSSFQTGPLARRKRKDGLWGIGGEPQLECIPFPVNRPVAGRLRQYWLGSGVIAPVPESIVYARVCGLHGFDVAVAKGNVRTTRVARGKERSVFVERPRLILFASTSR